MVLTSTKSPTLMRPAATSAAASHINTVRPSAMVAAWAALSAVSVNALLRDEISYFAKATS